MNIAHLTPQTLPDFVLDLHRDLNEPGRRAQFARMVHEHHEALPIARANISVSKTIEALLHAQPFLVLEPMTTLLAHAGGDIPRFQLHRDDVPAPEGLVVFDRGVMLPFQYQEPVEAMRGFSWWSWHDQQQAGIHLTLWYSALDDAESRAEADTLAVQGWTVPALMPRYQASWRYGELWEEHPAARGAQAWPAWIAAFFRLIQEELVVVDPLRVPRAARRRAAQVAPDFPEHVQVVLLRKRRAADPSQPASGAPVEWAHQWIVKEHWRNQWYPSQQRHAPRLIGPYPKGPKDKPFKPPATTVFAVKR